ncbi:MAG: fatty acid desaturase [Planctomycetota bacterium]
MTELQAETGAAPVRLRSQELPPEFLAISSWRGTADALLIWVRVGLVVAAAHWIGTWWAIALALPLIGACQNQLMVLWHHAIHQNLHPNKAVNDALARWLLIAPMGQPFGAMHRAHYRHHLRLGHADDPDRWYYDLDLHGRRDPRRFVRFLWTSCVGGLLIPQLRKLLTGKRDASADPGLGQGESDSLDRLSVLVAQAVLFGALWLGHGHWWSYFALWALPAVTFGAGFNTLRTVLEHADPADPPQQKLSFRPDWLERAFIAPLHMDHHWEHHLVMRVPYYRMPAFRKLLLERNAYGEGRLKGTYRERVREIVGAAG